MERSRPRPTRPARTGARSAATAAPAVVGEAQLLRPANHAQ
jgi:hypothetical protein